MSFFAFFYTAIIFAGIAFSWLLAVLNALLRNFIKWKDVSIVNTFAFFVVPLLLIVAAYIAIFFAAKKSLKEHRRRSLKKVISNFLSVTQRSIASLVNTSCLDYFFFCSEMMTDFVTVTLSLVLFLSLLLTVFWKHSTKSVGSVVQCRQGSERSLVINSKLKTSKNDWDRSGLPTKHTLSSSRFVNSFY